MYTQIHYSYTCFLDVYAQFNLIYLLEKKGSKNPLIVYLTENICKKFEIQLVVIHICFQIDVVFLQVMQKLFGTRRDPMEWGKEGLHINEIGIHVQTIKTIN